MPGGLRDVTQRFDADASGYIAAIQAMIGKNRDLIDSIGEVKAAIDSIGDAKVVKISVDTDGAMADIRAFKAALDGLDDRTVTVGVKYLTVGDRPDAGDVTRTVTTKYVNVGDAGTAAGDLNADIIAAIAAIRARDAAATSGLAQAADDAARLEASTKAAGDSARAWAKSVSDATAATAGAAAGAAAARGGGGGPWPAAVWSPHGQGPAGGAGLWPAAAMFAGGGGGLLGGGGGADGGWLGGGGPASAGAQATAVVGFVKRWWTAVHWTMMATNEILATVGPAAAAAGAATLVGWQGVEQMIPRIQAINATAESIGPALGITSGQYLGTGNAIQQYQNLATGGVYELGGAGINLMRSGAGGFGQTGLNTIAMLDRGVAQMQVNMAQRGTMGTLQGLLSGGTGYLKQFGDIGANLGDIFLGLAPHLPGVGGDYLSVLQGLTGGIGGGIGFLNQHGMGGLLGAGLAGEAGWRVGTPLVGLLGKGLTGLGGLAGKAGLGAAGMTAEDVAALADLTGIDAGAGAIGLGGEGLAGLLTAGGAGLGLLGGPEVAAAAIAAMLIGKGVTTPTMQQRQIAALQAPITAGGYAGAWQPLGAAVTAATGLSEQTPGQIIAATGVAGGVAHPGVRGGVMTMMNAQQQYTDAATGFAQTMGNLVNSGPQLQAALAKAGMKGVSMADAFQIAQNSLLDLSHAFDSHGNLTKQAQQMLGNYVSAIGPMTQSAGAFNAAIMGQQIMASPAVQNLSKVNQAMDAYQQIIAAGPTGMAGLAATKAGIPSSAAMSKALTSFTTPAGAAAWNTFASTSTTQPGIVTQMQQFNDQMRTGLTLGGLSQGQAAGLTGYELKQFLPMAKQSPAALAMLMQQGAQMGVTGYYDQSKSQAQNYAAAVAATSKIADNARQANAAMTSMTVHLANMPAVAKQFAQGTAAQIQSQEIAKAAQDAINVKGGINIKANVADLIGQLKAAGVQGGTALKNSLDAVLAQAGVSKAAIAKINIQAFGAAAAQAQINGVHGKTVNVITRAETAAAQAAINAIHGKTVSINVVENILANNLALPGAGPGGTPYTAAGVAANAAGAFTRIQAQTGRFIPGYGGGDIIPLMGEPGELMVPKHMVAAGLVDHLRGSIPGFAGGGVIGGAQSLTQIQAQINAIWSRLDLLYGQEKTTTGSALTQIKSQVSDIWKNQLDPLYAQKDTLTGKSGTSSSTAAKGTAAAQTPQEVLNQLLEELNKAGAWKQAGVTIIKGITDTFKTPGVVAETAKLAGNLVSAFQTEMNYARSVAAAAVTGQGYGTAGLISGYTVDTPAGTGAGAAPPGAKGYNAAAWNAANAYAASDATPGQTVAQQMQSYLSSVQAFTKDLATLSKDHLSKALISQLVAAGPVQGDALAQSILTGQGGVGAVNKLWAQIGQSSKGLGAQAGMAMYGGTIAPNLKSGTISIGGITVNVNAPGGAGGNLNLTPAQIKIITEEVQAALLKQARRNNRTGVKAPGKGA